MPQYRFTHPFELVLHGLAHGVNAVVERAEHHGEAPPEGSTVVARDGDLITTTEPYPHAHMVNTVTGQPDQPEAAETATEASAPPEVPASPGSSDSDDTDAGTAEPDATE